MNSKSTKAFSEYKTFPRSKIRSKSYIESKSPTSISPDNSYGNMNSEFKDCSDIKVVKENICDVSKSFEIDSVFNSIKTSRFKNS